MDDYKTLRVAANGTAAKVLIDRLELAELLQEFDCARLDGALRPAKGQYSDEFEEAWSHYPKRPGNSKAAAYKAWKSRIKAGAKPEAMINGVIAYAAYCKAERTEPQYIKRPETFFGPGEHYMADWKPMRRAADRAVGPLLRAVPDLDEVRQRSTEEAKRLLGGARRAGDDDAAEMVQT